MSETPPAGDTPVVIGSALSPSPPPAAGVPSPAELAARAMDDPLFPERGPRCLRCGERAVAPRPEKKEDPPPEPPKVCSRCKVVLREGDAATGITLPRVWWQELLLGASYVPRGAFRVLFTPGLWKYAVVPLAINVAVVILTGWLAWMLCDWLARMTNTDALTSWTGWPWGAVAVAVEVLGWVARGVFMFLVAILTACLIVAWPFNILYKLLFMPFMELLTEATERKVLAIDEDAPFEFSRFYANLIVAIVDAVLLTFLQGLVYLLFCPLAFVPGLNVIWLIVPPTAFAGMDYTDINLVRRGYVLREKVRLWRVHRWRVFGYGASFFFLLAVPVVNAFVIPAAAAGGALLYLGLPRK